MVVLKTQQNCVTTNALMAVAVQYKLVSEPYVRSAVLGLMIDTIHHMQQAYPDKKNFWH